MQGLLEEFWENQELVTRQNGYHEPHFRATCVMTQRDIASPTLLNVAATSVVRHWTSMTVEDEAFIQSGLGHAFGRRLGIFYAYDGVMGSQDPEWLQGALNILIRLLLRIGLAANVAKSKTMTCQLGAIRSGVLEEAFGWSSTGKG